MDIGKKIKTLRELRGLSQGKLSRLSSVQQAHISQIESGKKKYPNANTLQLLASALGVSMAEFDDNSIDDKSIDIKREKVLKQLDHMDLNEEQQAALAYIKKMPLDKQQQSFLEIYKKFKSLSVSDQEAVSKIIDSLASSHK